MGSRRSWQWAVVFGRNRLGSELGISLKRTEGDYLRPRDFDFGCINAIISRDGTSKVGSIRPHPMLSTDPHATSLASVLLVPLLPSLPQPLTYQLRFLLRINLDFRLLINVLLIVSSYSTSSPMSSIVVTFLAASISSFHSSLNRSSP